MKRIPFGLKVALVAIAIIGIAGWLPTPAHGAHNVNKHPAKVTRWTPEVVRIFTAHGLPAQKYLPRTLRCIHRESHGGTWANPKRRYWGLLQCDRKWSFPRDRDGSGREASCTVAPWQACGSCSIHAMAHKIRTEGIRRVQGRWRTWR